MNPAPHNTIILVDDEKSYTDLMAHMLEVNLGCPVAAFTRPLDALSALPSIDPAVFVTDYHMPQLDGLQLIRLAAPLAPRTAFLLITGHNLAAVQDEIEALSPLRGMLAKPFGWRTLADEILRVWPKHVSLPAPRSNAELR